MDRIDNLIAWCDQYRIPTASLLVDTVLKIDNPNFTAITNLPKEIDVLQDLKELHINRTQLASLPDEIGNLENLETLDLWHNQLNAVPASIGKLQKLKKLVLSGNKLTSVPIEIGNCKNLQELWLKENPLLDGEIDRLAKQLPNCTIYCRNATHDHRKKLSSTSNTKQ